MSNVVLSNTDYSVIGSRPIRPDGADKVTGRAQYGADFQMSGLLYGKVLRSPYAHARIKSIDTTKAEAYPGVVSVVTAKDIPTVQRNRPEGGFTPNENVLAVSFANTLLTKLIFAKQIFVLIQYSLRISFNFKLRSGLI